MSANRSVQAAQRRRSGPTDATPGRGPQPSINSSQMFANQTSSPNVRPGQGAIPRVANQQQQQQQKPEGLSSVNKMTIPQAITLITLRLGSVESKLMNLEHGEGFHNGGLHGGVSHIEGHENMALINTSVIESITSRLESLEKRTIGGASSSTSGPEFNLLKQQVETLKQSVIQSKGSMVSLTKDNKDLKITVDNLKRELSETKELLASLQTLAMDNSQKLLDFSINSNAEYTPYLPEDNLDDGTIIETNWEESDQNEMVGTNLKALIESEINAEN